MIDVAYGRTRKRLSARADDRSAGNSLRSRGADTLRVCRRRSVRRRARSPLTAQDSGCTRGPGTASAPTASRWRRWSSSALIVVFVLSAGMISTVRDWLHAQENHLADKLKPPMTDGYILGSDGNGRDILTRLAYGGRVSIMIAVLSAFATFFLGGAIGLLSGYAGGTTDAIIMRARRRPPLHSRTAAADLDLLALFAGAGRVWRSILAFVSWPGIARIVRGEVLALRGREYVDAARTLGASSTRIVLRHILPNVMPLLVVYISLIIPGLILAETDSPSSVSGCRCRPRRGATCWVMRSSFSAPTSAT